MEYEIHAWGPEVEDMSLVLDVPIELKKTSNRFRPSAHSETEIRRVELPTFDLRISRFFLNIP